MVSTELAWAAGFFDGEGTTFLRKERRHKGGTTGKMYPLTSPVLSVAQVELEPLDRFARAVDGRRPGGPYKPRNDRSRPYHRWDACGRPSVHRILSLLWPYLSGPKKEQAREVWREMRRLRTPKSPALPELPE